VNALCVFLVELTRSAIEGSDVTLVNLVPASRDGVQIRTDHGSTLHRVYWHTRHVHGARDWWNS